MNFHRMMKIIDVIHTHIISTLQIGIDPYALNAKDVISVIIIDSRSWQFTANTIGHPDA